MPLTSALLAAVIALEPLRLTQHERAADGSFGPPLTNVDITGRRLASTASIFGDVALTSIGGTVTMALGGRNGPSSSRVLNVGESVFGPFEAGFTSAQDNVIQTQMGCPTPELCYSAGGIDVELSEAVCANACGIELPRVVNSRWYGFLDNCGGHTNTYHFHRERASPHRTRAVPAFERSSGPRSRAHAASLSRAA